MSLFDAVQYAAGVLGICLKEALTDQERSRIAAYLKAHSMIDWDGVVPADPSLPKAVLLSDATAGLTDELELELRGHLAAGFAVTTKRFLQHGAHDATYAQWRNAISGSAVYHQIGHGQVRCTRHNSAFDVNAMYKSVIGNYPWCCPADTDRENALSNVQGDSIADMRRIVGLRERAYRQMSSAEAAHLAESYMIYGDNELTIGPGDVAQWIDQAPTTLVYLSCCVCGWDEKLPMAFINKGARYVIAYRRYADDTLSVATSIAFYSYWKALGFAADQIPTAFNDVVMTVGNRLHPVLYERGKATTPRDKLDPLAALT